MKNNRDNIVKVVETFLGYSDEKLEELSKKNQELKVKVEKERDNNA
ncbi:SP_0009 family protein [Streptococcus sp. DD13]|nr:SP_0009 family protein [Streptococcus sp. DD13]